ncbi:MAG: sodium-dependent transporter [Victivallales bacterium]|nr:sodium-dependent transporter [Victivallales bacterium]
MRHKRENWGSRAGFLLAAIGSAIGLGNLWRFPYITYENGGGAFLIPYFFALITAGIPIIILEMAIGHRFKSSPPKAFRKMSKKMEWLGWLQMFVSFVIVTYYAVIVAWLLKYVFLSFTLGWGASTKDFFYSSFLKISNSPLDFGSINFNTLIFLTILWIGVWLVCFSGIQKGIEVIVKIFMPILFILVIIMLIKVVTLKGAGYGLDWLFKPRFDRILEFSTWTEAYGQVFFSLSICFGIMIAYSSYLPDKSDIANNATMAAFVNCGFSILASIVIFSVLGYTATAQGVGIKEVAGSGIGLAFITIPTAVNLMPASRLIGSLFFTALTVAGFTSVISLVEVPCSTVMEYFRISRKKASTIFCIIGYAVGLIYTCRSGIFILDIVDYFMNSFGIIFCGIAEIIFICWFFKIGYLKEYINRKSDFTIGGIWTFLLKYFIPIFLSYMAFLNFKSNITGNYGNYSTPAVIIFGWGVTLIIVIISVLIPEIYEKRKGNQ